MMVNLTRPRGELSPSFRNDGGGQSRWGKVREGEGTTGGWMPCTPGGRMHAATSGQWAAAGRMGEETIHAANRRPGPLFLQHCLKTPGFTARTVAHAQTQTTTGKMIMIDARPWLVRALVVIGIAAAMTNGAGTGNAMCAYECNPDGNTAVATVVGGVTFMDDCPLNPYPPCPGAFIDHAEAFSCDSRGNGTTEDGQDDCQVYSGAINNASTELRRLRAAAKKSEAEGIATDFVDIDFFLVRYNITDRLLDWGIDMTFRKTVCGFTKPPTDLEARRADVDTDSISFKDVANWIESKGKMCVKNLGARALCTFLTDGMSVFPFIQTFCQKTVLSILGLPIVNKFIEGATKVVINVVKEVARTAASIARSIFCFGFCSFNVPLGISGPLPPLLLTHARE